LEGGFGRGSGGLASSLNLEDPVGLLLPHHFASSPTKL